MAKEMRLSNNIRVDENGFRVCSTTDKLQEENPEQYDLLIKALAELDDCKARKKEMNQWEKDIISRIHDLMPKGIMEIPGFGKVTKSTSKSKKWDNEAMWDILIARALDSRLIDKETGEVLEREASAVRRVIEECAYVSYWRTTPLIETYGIDPEEYYETSNPKPALRIQ